ncbi:phosphate binding protein [Halovivax ruber XH-70]|uniref:Phosphate binding protein n=1 Tax=Halovivax ruber (strain DSM 18193 / JCM 13892 / XH-70) TaxID=797302 RepID=L0IBK5_HALRX|nr:PstS family phosphate ABC transporter substrate-binding protein [Halovivax ruber]AGB15307.1 phosphate binding protein [Halovivax ruber XH-70]
MSDDRFGRFTGGVSRRNFIAAAGAVGAVSVAGCSETEGDEGEGDLSGNIRISGSSTVYPVATAVGELFKEEQPEVTIDLSKDGSSGGFENVFIPGDADINNASRAIKEEEIQACQDNGFEPVEFEVAKDALTVVVNNDNEFIDSLTYDELEAIWTPDDTPETWADVNADWPDEEIELFGPASTSGTFDYFTETILGEAGRIRSDFTGTEEDDQIAEGVQGNEFALGYLPFAYYMNNPDETVAVPLAATESEDPVEPSLDAASTGEYALARPLFFYANSEKVAEKEHLQEFIRFYIDKTTDKKLMAERIGYVQSSEDRATENIEKLEEYL